MSGQSMTISLVNHLGALGAEDLAQVAAICFETAAPPPPQHEGNLTPLTLRRPWDTAVSKACPELAEGGPAATAWMFQ